MILCCRAGFDVDQGDMLSMGIRPARPQQHSPVAERRGGSRKAPPWVTSDINDQALQRALQPWRLEQPNPRHTVHPNRSDAVCKEVAIRPEMRSSDDALVVVRCNLQPLPNLTVIPKTPRTRSASRNRSSRHLPAWKIHDYLDRSFTSIAEQFERLL